MLALDARFALLVIFCGISTRWIAPGASVSAAAISRTPNDQGLRDLAPGAQRTSSHAQHVLPWPDKTNGRTAGYQKRDESLMQRTNSHDFTRSKVRMNDFTLANPFQKIADAVYSSVKRKGHHKRSKRTVSIPNADGSSSYQVDAETPQWRTRGKTSRPVRRQEMDGIPGVVAIESNVYNSTEGHILGYLFVNATSVVNASETNKTVLYLLDSNTTSRESVASASDSLKSVLLCQLDDGEGTRCLTYNSNPPTAESMTMQQRNNPPAGTSQVFIYNLTSGGLNPTAYSGTSESPAQAASSPDNSTSAAQTNTTTSTDLASRDSNTQSSGTRSVKLVFIPSGQAAAEADDPAFASPAATAATTTTTHTVTVFATGSMGAADVSASGTPTASNSAPFASQSGGGLNVELVGDASSPSNPSNGTQASSSNTGAAIAATQSQSSTSVNAAAAATPSPSINAASVAASIAASASSSKSAALASMSSAAAAASASAASSASGAAASASSSASAEYVAAVMQRAPAPRLTAVSTEPYQWKFKAESR